MEISQEEAIKYLDSTKSTYEFRVVNTSTLVGIEAAEKLQEDGWSISFSGVFCTTFKKLKD